MMANHVIILFPFKSLSSSFVITLRLEHKEIRIKIGREKALPLYYESCHSLSDVL